jgi:hypothetical protein
MKRNSPKDETCDDREQASERRERADATERPPFERPRVRRLGKLPAVTTAFGGSFDP